MPRTRLLKERLKLSRLLLGNLLFKKLYKPKPRAGRKNCKAIRLSVKPVFCVLNNPGSLSDKTPSALNKYVIRKKKVPVKATDSKNAFG